MESAAVLRSVHYSFSTASQLRNDIKTCGMLTINNPGHFNLRKFPICGGRFISSSKRSCALVVSSQRTSETTATASNGDPNGAILSDGQQNGVLEKKTPFTATFPNGFETLLTEVCDETKIAELKVKFGAFEIHMKRNIDTPAAPAPAYLQATALPVPSTPKESASAPPPPPPKASVEKVGPFTNVSVEKATKLAALEASGATGYVIVSSPTVGSFRRARTLKGKKQPPACKEGDVIKEGQTIGFLDQFGTELPVKADVSGEVLKLLYADGEAVGYGDPLIAVLPSFHGIQ